MQSFFIMNSNKDKSVVATDYLNDFSAFLRTQPFSNRISQEGFELNFIDFKWEYIIKFNKKSGFMVLREYDSVINIFVYEKEDSIEYTRFDVSKSSFTKPYYKNIIQILSKMYKLVK